MDALMRLVAFGPPLIAFIVLLAVTPNPYGKITDDPEEFKRRGY